MEETLRMTKDAKRPYFAFTKFTFDPYAEDMLFYREMDLCTTLQQTADLGGSGVVIWSSTSSTSSASKCKQIAEYMKNLFGPTSHRVIQGAQKCSNDRCSGHGACESLNSITVHTEHISRKKNKTNTKQNGISGAGVEPATYGFLRDSTVHRSTN
uniref:Hyaluronidase n=1 Tax=Plectus sambesii TaxID=2011161 RepID=A0A914USR9_9BILA